MDVRNGAVDSYIRAYARDVRGYGKPVLITPFVAEFNGTWWWAVSPDMNHGLTTDDFVQAWRRVVDIFRAVGASNVSWAWIVNIQVWRAASHTRSRPSRPALASLCPSRLNAAPQTTPLAS